MVYHLLCVLCDYCPGKSVDYAQVPRLHCHSSAAFEARRSFERLFCKVTPVKFCQQILRLKDRKLESITAECSQGGVGKGLQDQHASCVFTRQHAISRNEATLHIQAATRSMHGSNCWTGWQRLEVYAQAPAKCALRASVHPCVRTPCAKLRRLCSGTLLCLCHLSHTLNLLQGFEHVPKRSQPILVLTQFEVAITRLTTARCDHEVPSTCCRSSAYAEVI